MTRKQRKNYSAEEKVAILKQHFLEQKPISDICDQYNLHPTVFYRWQKEFFDNASSAFKKDKDKSTKRFEKKIKELEDKLTRKNEVLSELMEEHVALKKKQWGPLKNIWVEPDTRDSIINFIAKWQKKTGIMIKTLITWIGINFGRYNAWKQRYGFINMHNSWLPRDYWLLEWEKEAIISYYFDHPLDGYRRITYMMIDENIVAVSPSTVYRILSAAYLLGNKKITETQKGKGFIGPTRPHEHWHVDISYLNIGGTFYYLCCIIDGYSRFLVHWEIREQMKEQDVEIIIQRARELFPGVNPRIISDNGPQFIARDFKEFIRIGGMTHVRTSPYYPQSNGKIERWHQTLKKECIRPYCPVSLEDARRIVKDFVDYYNNVRLHSSIGYIAPKDKLEGREIEIFKVREQRIEAAREQRKMNNIEIEVTST